VSREYVGIDLHRRRSVIVRKNSAGEVLSKVHIDNDPMALAAAVSAAGPNPEVVLEATFGWYWAADVLADLGATVHLAHPLGNNWGNRRVKNDERDAADLVDLLRMGRLAEAWIAPPAIRELREMTRYRHKLSQLRGGLKAQVHAVMCKNGVLPKWTTMWGPAGTAQPDSLELPMAYSLRLESLRDLIELYGREIEILDRRIHTTLKDDTGYKAVQAIHGVGPVLAAVFVAEIGDVGRFPSPDHLCSWAGLTPRHRGVRHQGAARLDNETGLEDGALGRHRGHQPQPRRRQDQGRLPPRFRAAGSQHRPHRRGQESAPPGVLRPA
jgi:transposase